MKGKKTFWKKSDGIKILTVITSLVVITSSIFVFLTVREVRDVIVSTKPDLRAEFMAWLTGRGGGIYHDGILNYRDEENIECLEIDVDIVNIGSGVAYDLTVELSLPGLKYSPSPMGEWGGVELYIEGKLIETHSSYGRDTFSFRIISLSPEGGEKNIGLDIPFDGIGSTDNLPTSCIIKITDIDKKILLEKIITFQVFQRSIG